MVDGSVSHGHRCRLAADVDGTPVGTHTALTFAPFRLRTTRNWIGRSQFARDRALNGLVDDFRIYRGALIALQVSALAR